MLYSVVLTGHDNWPETYMHESPEQAFMQDWSRNMSRALAPLLDPAETPGRPRSGVFAAACYTHGDFSATYPILHGMNYYTAFSNFYFNTSTPAEYKLADDCGLMCNPTCSCN